MGGTGKLVCPWGREWAGPIETAPSASQECYSVSDHARKGDVYGLRVNLWKLGLKSRADWVPYHVFRGY